MGVYCFIDINIVQVQSKKKLLFFSFHIMYLLSNSEFEVRLCNSPLENSDNPEKPEMAINLKAFDNAS